MNMTQNQHHHEIFGGLEVDGDVISNQNDTTPGLHTVNFEVAAQVVYETTPKLFGYGGTAHRRYRL